ncbi:TP901 family phage tail tape measure protein [Brevibacillus brevis]|nr:TP901 family phage tail tape measure protein [Brevibacillus brevis]TQK42117.1 TP901 family phage tail tape measure protein [Brevibacillus sp. AG162]VEF86788.1 Phage-related minor tail protein [Brevibacillus brevis]
MSGPAGRIVQQMQRVRESVAQTGQTLRTIGNQAAVAGTAFAVLAASGVGLIGGLIQPAVAVQDALAPLEVVTTSTMGSMQKSLEASKNAAIEWSMAHKQAVAEFLDANTTMGSAGLNDIQALEGTRQALALATATKGDNIEAANLLAVVYNNVGDKTKDVTGEMTRLADVMAKSQALFQYANLNTMNESLKYAIPSALGAKHGFEELNIVLGQLNNAGLQGSMAGTAYSAFMRQILKASGELGFAIAKNADGSFNFIATLEQIQNKYGDLSKASPQVQMAFQKAFGDEGIRAVQLLLPQIDNMKKALQDLGDSAGVTAEMQAIMEQAPTAQWQILQNNIKAVQLQLGDALLPVLQSMIPPIQSVVQSLSGFMQAHPILAQIIGQFLLWGTVIFGLLAVLAFSTTAVLYMASSLMQLWQGLVWAGKGIGTLRTKLWGMITALYQSSVAAFRLGMVGLRMLAQSAVTLAVRFWALLPSIWATTVALLANPFTWIVVGIVALMGALIWLGQNYDMVRDKTIELWNTMTTWFMNGWNWVMGILNQAIAFLQQWGPTFLAIFMPIIGVPMLIAQHWDQIVAYLSNLWQTFKNSGAGLIEAFVQGIQSVINKPYEVMEQALTKLRQLLPFSDAKEGPLSELTRSGRAVPGTIAEGIAQAGRVLPQALQKAMDPMLQGIQPISIPVVPAFAGDAGMESASDSFARRSSSSMFSGFFGQDATTDGSSGGSISQSSSSVESRQNTYNFNLYQSGSSDHSLLSGIRRYLEAHEE